MIHRPDGTTFCPYTQKECKVERTQGEWIDNPIKLEDGRHSKFNYKCSVCGSSDWYKANFCHDCGAEMRGNKE